MNFKVPEIFAMAITTLQVGQMIAGVSLNVYTLYVWGKMRMDINFINVEVRSESCVTTNEIKLVYFKN